jgi:HNH endonuclease
MVVKQMLNDLCREVSKLIDYDPLSGDFVWKVLPEVSKSVRGKKAGSIRRDGYVYVMFRNKRLLAHRIAWCISTGELPSQLDHINMKRSDNRLCNLRAATNAQNSRNKGRQRNNSTGFKGVTFNKSVKRFQAKICTNGITRSLGYFDSAIEAHNAYANASGVLHEEFARC